MATVAEAREAMLGTMLGTALRSLVAGAATRQMAAAVAAAAVRTLWELASGEVQAGEVRARLQM
eukprot:2020473-Lingulodinium_polyedra.AAC.1